MKNPLTLIYFSINILGAILFFYFGYRIVTLAKLEERNYYDGVDGITFSTQVIPVIVVCFLLNIIWAIKTIVEIFRYRSYSSSIWFIAVLISWVTSFLMIRLIS